MTVAMLSHVEVFDFRGVRPSVVAAQTEMGVLIPKAPPHDSLFTSHRSRVVLVAATALRATAASVSGVLNLGASHGADIYTFAVEVM